MERLSLDPLVCCLTCERPHDLRCGDCGCPPACHDLITHWSPDQPIPWCAWEHAPCYKERSPQFIAAIRVVWDGTRPPSSVNTAAPAARIAA
jgi:hypothetical protein